MQSSKACDEHVSRWWCEPQQHLERQARGDESGASGAAHSLDGLVRVRPCTRSSSPPKYGRVLNLPGHVFLLMHNFRSCKNTCIEEIYFIYGCHKSPDCTAPLCKP